MIIKLVGSEPMESQVMKHTNELWLILVFTVMVGQDSIIAKHFGQSFYRSSICLSQFLSGHRQSEYIWVVEQFHFLSSVVVIVVCIGPEYRGVAGHMNWDLHVKNECIL